MYTDRQWCDYEQLQQMRNAASKQKAETTKSKDDCNDLRATITNIRDKINNLDAQVRHSFLYLIGIARGFTPGRREKNYLIFFARRLNLVEVHRNGDIKLFKIHFLGAD